MRKFPSASLHDVTKIFSAARLACSGWLLLQRTVSYYPKTFANSNYCRDYRCHIIRSRNHFHFKLEAES